MGDKTVLPQIFAEIDLNYYMDLVRDDSSVMEELRYAPSKVKNPDKRLLLILTSASLGEGKKCGTLLIMELLQSIIRNSTKPGTIILLNDAVKLAEQKSSSERLTVLEEFGIKIMVCISSADKYGIMDSIKVGFLASMDEIYNAMVAASKIITL